MSLATAAADGAVSSRLVLLRLFDQDGFVFFSGYETQKARDINANPKAALLFPWLALERQVRVEGTAVQISKTESIQFFAARRRGSQLGAWLTQSSEIISSRHILHAKMAELKRKFQAGQVPFPSAWGGYRLIPTRLEFWQASPDGLHDRFEYTKKTDAGWNLQRLLP